MNKKQKNCKRKKKETFDRRSEEYYDSENSDLNFREHDIRNNINETNNRRTN